MHGDVERREAGAEKAGCPWNAIDSEERQFQLAQYHVSTGELDKARLDLRALPSSALAQRKGRQALSGDDGAGFYGWIQQSVAAPEAYTADHVLLEWLGDDGKPEQIEAILRNFADTDFNKLSGYLKLAERYKSAGDTAKATGALDHADKLIDLVKDQKTRDRLKTLLLVQRPLTEGTSLAAAIKASGVLEKYRGEAWLVARVGPLLEAGEVPVAEQIAAACEMNDKLRGQFAIAADHKAGRLKEALALVDQATEPLGPARILLVIALQQKSKRRCRSRRKNGLSRHRPRQSIGHEQLVSREGASPAAGKVVHDELLV